jgi:hypothetical protein
VAAALGYLPDVDPGLRRRFDQVLEPALHRRQRLQGDVIMPVRAGQKSGGGKKRPRMS